MHERFAKVIEPASGDAKLLAAIDPERLPRHIAVIMDGNGRWAKMRGKPRIFGHKAGAESVRSILDTCARLKIEALTLYAFSTENWKRPKAEVTGLMSMLKRYIRSEMAEVASNNIRFQAIGNIAGLSDTVQKELAWATDRPHRGKHWHHIERRPELRRPGRDPRSVSAIGARADRSRRSA